MSGPALYDFALGEYTNKLFHLASHKSSITADFNSNKNKSQHII